MYLHVATVEKKHNLEGMRAWLPGIFAVWVMASCSPATRLYFVRHAEKSALPANDPDLSAAGRARAELLAGLLRDKGIRAIHVTDTRRSRQTAEPLAAVSGLTLTTYSNDTVHRFLYHLLEADRSALVVGHSNTVLAMLRELGLRPSREALSDADYDGLWLVLQKEKEGRGGYRLLLRERSYGARPAGVDTLRGRRGATGLRSRGPSRSTSGVSR